MRWLLACVSLFSLLGLLALAQAQPPQAQPAASTFQVRLRYKIDAELQQRYALYKQMLERLQSVGFVAAPGRPREELFGDQLAGTLPNTGLSTLRLERFLRTAVLVPTGYQLPADAEKTVLVRLELVLTGPDRQKELSVLARQQLKSLGFVENEGYDHQRHTRLLGRLPGPALDVLLKDTMEVTIPSSFKTSTIISAKVPLVRMAVVIAESAPPQPDVALPTPAPAGKEYLDKISPDLKAYLAKVPEADLEKFMRVELVLRTNQLTNAFRGELLHSETLFITEGSLGPIVTGLTPPSRLATLAQQPDISTVRLPQAAWPISASYEIIPLGRDLGTSSIITPVNFSQPRPARRLLFIGDDFRGYQKLIGEGLPRNTRLIDATAELSTDMRPMPEIAGDGIGRSTQLVREFLQHHPHDEVVLARIESTTPYQVQALGESVLGRSWLTPALLSRKDEYSDAGARLEAERRELRVLRRRIQGDFTLDDETKAKREEYRKRQTALDAADKSHYELGKRFEQFNQEMNSLTRMTTICVGLQWTDGYSDLPASLPHLRFVTNDVFKGANWYQIVSNRPRQVWTGLFRDYDSDSVMEFTTNPNIKRPDLAFLAWRPERSSTSENTLPENAVVQITLNWFEVHAPGASADDPYRKPQANLKVNVLKQRDPTGLKLPIDAFEVVARTPILADRVENSPRGSHYQSIVRFTVPPGGGRYALEVTGSVPSSTGDINAAERAEIHPKLSLEVVDPLKRPTGRVVFEYFATPE